jgi:hypothetical protein
MKDDIKRNKQAKQFHLQLKSEQKEMIQNVLERKDSMAVLPTGFGKSMRYVPPPTPLILDKVRSYICQSSPMIHCGNRSFLEIT